MKDLRRPEEVAALRGLSVDSVLGLGAQEESPVETLPAEAEAEPVEA